MINELKNVINARAVRAGFTEKDFDDGDNSSLPYGCVYWEASYASILLWPLDSLEKDAFRTSIQTAERRLDSVLSKRENPGVVIDGYLVLAALEDISKLEWAKQIEHDTQLCRKHLVWIRNSCWVRIERIAVLGLGSALGEDEVEQLPTEDDSTRLLIEQLSQMTPRALARQHGTAWSDDA